MPIKNPETLKAIHHKLSEEEIKNPQLVIDGLFDYAGLENLRVYLWDWFKVSVTGTFNTHLMDIHRRYDMIVFYEHLERIMEAVHVIYIKNKKEKRKGNKSKP